MFEFGSMGVTNVYNLDEVILVKAFLDHLRVTRFK